MEMHGAAHHLGYVHGCTDMRRRVVSAEHYVLRPYAEGYILGLNIIGPKRLLLFFGQVNPCAVQLYIISVSVLIQFGIKEVHLRSSYEARHEEVCRVVEHLLRGAYLLNESVPHYDYAVAQGHSLGLVVSNVDEGSIYPLAQLYYLRTHLIAQLCIQIGKRFIHQEYGRVTHYRASYGHTLTLSAGKGLGLSVEVLGYVQYLRRFLYLAVYLVLGGLLELEGESHILIYRHMRVQGVVLEYHGYIPVLRSYIVHKLVAYVQLASGNVFKSRYHAQGCGLSATGGAYQHDEFLVCNVKVELLHRYDALIGNLKIMLLFRLVLGLFLGLTVWVDLFDVSEAYFCHILFSAATVLPPQGTASG